LKDKDKIMDEKRRRVRQVNSSIIISFILHYKGNGISNLSATATTTSTEEINFNLKKIESYTLSVRSTKYFRMVTNKQDTQQVQSINWNFIQLYKVNLSFVSKRCRFPFSRKEIGMLWNE
jgi:hypothetical protein